MVMRRAEGKRRSNDNRNRSSCLGGSGSGQVLHRQPVSSDGQMRSVLFDGTRGQNNQSVLSNLTEFFSSHLFQKQVRVHLNSPTCKDQICPLTIATILYYLA